VHVSRETLNNLGVGGSGYITHCHEAIKNRREKVENVKENGTELKVTGNLEMCEIQKYLMKKPVP
jgi:hypothetical protein